jgi:hypothetical protein
MFRLANQSDVISMFARRCYAVMVATAVITASTGCSLGFLTGHSDFDLEGERDPTQLSSETTTLLAALGFDRDTPNLDALEESADLKNISSSEGRALALSELWYRHAAELQIISPAGSLAAYLRSADIALEALLDDGCSSAFNNTCSTLNTKYSESTRAVVDALQTDSWKAPDLSRTRYSLMVKGDNGPLFLSDWQLTFPKNSNTSHKNGSITRRAGVGLAASGCRTFTLSKDDVGVCSPLTFVLSFSPLKRRDKVDAILSVYDAYQREVVAVKGRDLPLAADFGTSTATLSLSATEGLPTPPQLNCLSVPSAATTSIVALGAASSLERYRDTVGQLLSDPSIRSRFSFCFFDSSGQNAVDLSIDLQEVISPKQLAPTPGPVALLALDDSGRKMIPRAIKSVGAGSSRLKVSGVVTIQPQGTGTKEVDRLRKVLKSKRIPLSVASENRAPESLRKLRQDLRTSLLILPAPEPLKPPSLGPEVSTSPSGPADQPGEDLEVSSVL